MKRKLVALAVATSLLTATQALATTTTIDDNYWGGTPTDGNARDTIGSASQFAVDHMLVEFGQTSMTATVSTNFVNSIGALGAQLGDLFISTDGWHPAGAANYASDDASNGEQWEYAAVLDDHTGGKTSGTLSLYQVANANIVLSSLPGETFRENQEVQYNAGNQQAAYTGTWSIVDVAGTDADSLVFNVDFGKTLAEAGFGDLAGFHWTMTCANDVIEGAAFTGSGAHMPEPMSLVLLGSALGALGFKRRASKPVI